MYLMMCMPFFCVCGPVEQLMLYVEMVVRPSISDAKGGDQERLNVDEEVLEIFKF